MKSSFFQNIFSKIEKKLMWNRALLVVNWNRALLVIKTQQGHMVCLKLVGFCRF